MKLNEVIRKYRKEQNMTQEQLANTLGVSAPAVNKWESGSSYPDITLLAPLARALQINLDTLLSFQDELTDKEIIQIQEEVVSIMHQEGYDAGFAKCQEFILLYPNCDKLVLSLAQFANAYLTILCITDSSAYENKISAWYELISKSSDVNIASTAIASLCQTYISKKDYNKAQQLLDQIPPRGFDKRDIQAKLYFVTDREDEAYKIYEEKLLEAINQAYSSLQLIIDKRCTQKNYSSLDRYVNLSEDLSRLFDLGPYMECMPKLSVAASKQEKDNTLTQLDKLVTAMDHMTDFTKSSLFSHMTFKENNDISSVKLMLKSSLLNDADLAFVRDDHRFQQILNKL